MLRSMYVAAFTWCAGRFPRTRCVGCFHPTTSSSARYLELASWLRRRLSDRTSGVCVLRCRRRVSRRNRLPAREHDHEHDGTRRIVLLADVRGVVGLSRGCHRRTRHVRVCGGRGDVLSNVRRGSCVPSWLDVRRTSRHAAVLCSRRAGGEHVWRSRSNVLRVGNGVCDRPDVSIEHEHLRRPAVRRVRGRVARASLSERNEFERRADRDHLPATGDHQSRAERVLHDFVLGTRGTVPGRADRGRHGELLRAAGRFDGSVLRRVHRRHGVPCIYRVRSRTDGGGCQRAAVRATDGLAASPRC